ncbi:MAG TPA: adenosylmethionine--8-amino-7-oxononanoate transaminase [Solirubrobacteraceae bacterium]|nr:adenosylmethionine--8-amino-7-oxononanoate transaminase [Solirubrobacteraceae bacterium]
MGGPGREEELLALDRAHVWHPYASLPASAPPPLLVESAQGVRLRLADGRELIDGMSSWWCAIHGYRNPALDAAASAQLGRMAHVMFGGLTHEPAVELARRLVELTPPGLEHVFFADSGSVAVEVALKICLQAGRGERTRLLALRGGYHGDTFAAMSVCDPDDGMHSLFGPLLPRQLFAPRPPAGVDAPLQEEWAAAVRAIFERHGGELAAAIVEPIVQGAGGMWFYSPACLRLLRELCDSYGVLLVFDEIATGFGRSGTLFAADRAGVSPDVMCVGKALTGGYVTLAATLASAAVAARIEGPLMHGPTFMGNPLATAVALASLDLLESSDWRAAVARAEAVMTDALAPVAGIDGVRDVRVLGAIAVIETEAEVPLARASAAAIEAGVWLRPFRNLIYAMPPYVASEPELRAIAHAMAAAASVAVAPGAISP